MTLYGRKAVLEALRDPTLTLHCLHLATSNRPSEIIGHIMESASARQVEIRHHDRLALSRISRNSKQDQGVALDIRCESFSSVMDVSAQAFRDARLLALDGITNPQNVGMIIRSAVAAGIDGLLYPAKGVAALGPLVIKASSGTVFRAPTIFVLGSESYGISKYARELANTRVSIPMANAVESLNVAVAAALVAFHLAPKRH